MNESISVLRSARDIAIAEIYQAGWDDCLATITAKGHLRLVPPDGRDPHDNVISLPVRDAR